MNVSLQQRILPFALCAISLVIGVACGAASATAHQKRAARTASVEPAKADRGKVADRGERASLESLRARVRELEARLVALQAQGREATNESAEVVSAERMPLPRQSPRQWMEQMRKNNPEQYVQMTNRMAQWHSQRLQRTVSRLDALAGVDVSGWTKESQDIHAEYQDLLARREDLMAALRPDNEDEASRQQAQEELHRVWERMRELEERERVNLLADAARMFGLAGEDANALVETVQAVYDVTSDHGLGGRGGPRGEERHGPRRGGGR